MLIARSILESEIKKLEKDISSIYNLVIVAMNNLSFSLTNKDLKKANEIIQNDIEINNLCLSLEKNSYKLIAMQQPIGHDLIKIVSIIRLIPDIERIGDHIKLIAKNVKRVFELNDNKTISLLCESLIMLKDKFSSAFFTFINKDDKNARQIAMKDNEIDEISISIIKEITKEIQNDFIHLDDLSRLIILAKSIERIGDYIVNICETTIFEVTGDLVELS